MRAGSGPGLALLLIALAGCPSASFQEHGPTTLAPDAPGRLAMPRPLLEVTPPAAFEDEARRVEVTALRLTTAGTRVSLSLVDADTAGETAELAYTIGPGVALPLEVGGRYWLRTSAQRQGAGLLVWRAGAEPELIAALSIDRGLADDVVPGVTVLAVPIGDPVYTEVRALPSGCVTALDHLRLRVRAGQATVDIPPGERRRVQGGGSRSWDVLALDASRPTPGLAASDPARCPGGAHVSWLARAVPSGAPGAPASQGAPGPEP